MQETGEEMATGTGMVTVTEMGQRTRSAALIHPSAMPLVAKLHRAVVIRVPTWKLILSTAESVARSASSQIRAAVASVST